MRIGVIDADLIGRKKHRFPNLACEKIACFWKEKGAEVELLLGYNNLDSFDTVYISKVFTDTPFPEQVRGVENVKIGGTGFFFDKAPALPYEIEHHKPDYSLYNDWIEKECEIALKDDENFSKEKFMKQFKEYTDCSIGFLTRGCFRKCKFCVNQNYDKVFKHSPLEEFYDPKRRSIRFLDDNFFGFSGWKEELQKVKDLGVPFIFKQGLDERLLTEEKCEMLFSSRYDGDYIFAFDNVKDYNLIEKKLSMIRKYTTSPNIKFYILVGFESTDAKDIENAFIRIELLMRYGCLPYIMRYQSEHEKPYKNSAYSGMYMALANWCNQPNFFKKLSFREFCQVSQARTKTKGFICADMRAMLDFENKHKALADKYFDLKFIKFDEVDL